MASAKTEEISKEIIDRIEMDDDEELITPLNAKMLLMMENQQQYNERKFEELKIEIKEELKKDNKELKKDYRELKKDNKELKKDNKELKIEIKEELNLLKKSNEQLKKSNDRISKLLEQLLLKSDK